MFDPDQEAVDDLLGTVPEFADLYLALVSDADGEPGPAAALFELAEVAAGLARRAQDSNSVLGRLMAGVERLCSRSAEDEDLVAGAFLEALSPDDLIRLGPWLGPATRSALDQLQLPPAAGGDADSRGRSRTGPGT